MIFPGLAAGQEPSGPPGQPSVLRQTCEASPGGRPSPAEPADGQQEQQLAKLDDAVRDRILELYAEAPKSVFKNVPLNVAVFNGRVLYLIRNKRCRPPEAFLVNLLNSLRRAKAEKLSKPEAAAVKWFQTTVEKVFALLGAVQLLEGEARSAEPPVQRVCERGTSSEAPEKARLRLADRQPASKA